MKRSNRDDLLVRLLQSIKYADTYENRYNLGSLGESLVTEYKDLDRKQVSRELELLNCENR
jgi:hypothetical protein